MGSSQKNDRIETCACQPDHLNKVFLKLRAVDILEGIIDAELDEQNVRLKEINILVESVNTIKSCFSISRSVNHLDPLIK